MGGGASKGGSRNAKLALVSVVPSGGSSGTAVKQQAPPLSPPSPQHRDSQFSELVSDQKGTEKSALRIEELRERVEFDESGAEVGFPPPELYIAAGRGELARLTVLLKEATAESIAEKHWRTASTALHMAALCGNDECVAALLEADADRTVVDMNGLTPLHYAALCPSVECVDALLRGDTLEFENRHGQRLPLSHHVSNGDETALLLAVGTMGMGFADGTVQRLIEDEREAHGCPLNVQDCCSVTPLHLAAAADDEESAAALIKAGASTMAIDELGQTAVQVAITPRMESLLRGEPVPDIEEAWTRNEDTTLGTEGQTVKETATDEGRADWNLEDASEVFVASGGAPVFIGKALFSYSASQDDDISFEKDDEIEVIGEEIPGWDGWGIGRVGDRSGFFPLNYVARISDREHLTPSEKHLELHVLSEGAEDEESNIVGSAPEWLIQAAQYRGEMAGLEVTVRELSADLSLEKTTLVELTSEVASSRQNNEELASKLKESEDRASTEAAKHAAAAEARGAELKQLKTRSAKSESDEAAAVSEEQLENKDAEIAALKAELAAQRSKAEASGKEATDGVEAAERDRRRFAVIEKDLRTRLTQAQDAGNAMQRKIHSEQQEVVLLKMANKVAVVAKEQAVEKAAIDASGEGSTLEEVAELRADVASAKHQLVASTLLSSAHRARVERIGSLYREEAEKRRKLYNQVQDAQGNIRVYCRCRPLLPFEVERGDKSAVTVLGKEVVRVPDAHDPSTAKCFKFNACFSAAASQDEVFGECHDLIQSAFDGFNVCVFAYGQTGSGKTHTMYGDPVAPGLAPRTVEAIWRHIEVEKKRGGQFEVVVTMAELYLDGLSDLLLEPKKQTGKPPKLSVKKDTSGMVYIQNITEIRVGNVKETVGLLDVGQTRRHVSGTAMNAQSSRSHLVFSLVITSTGPTGVVKKGKVSLVDMAGSERVSRSEVTGEAFKEAVAINRSLSALLDVIDALSKKGKAAQSKTGVPYRNHQLTQLMSDSLGGNAKTLMFVNISPADSNLDETRGALGYATRASTITNKVERGGAGASNAAAAASAEVEKLRATVAALRAELEAYAGSEGKEKAGVLVRTATASANGEADLYA